MRPSVSRRCEVCRNPWGGHRCQFRLARTPRGARAWPVAAIPVRRPDDLALGRAHLAQQDRQDDQNRGGEEVALPALDQRREEAAIAEVGAEPLGPRAARRAVGRRVCQSARRLAQLEGEAATRENQAGPFVALPAAAPVARALATAGCPGRAHGPRSCGSPGRAGPRPRSWPSAPPCGRRAARPGHPCRARPAWPARRAPRTAALPP